MHVICKQFYDYKKLMAAKEAKARLKINNLLIDAWWRFFDTKDKTRNIEVESDIKIFDEWSELWDDFENVKRWFADYLYLMTIDSLYVY